MRHVHRSWISGFALALLALLGRPAQGAPTITVTNPVIGNNVQQPWTLVWPKDCTGSLCDGPCSWTAADLTVNYTVTASSGSTLRSVSTKIGTWAPPNGARNYGVSTPAPGFNAGSTTYSGNVAAASPQLNVICNVQTGVAVEITAVERFNNLDSTTTVEFLFDLTCRRWPPPPEQPRANSSSNGQSRVPSSATPLQAYVQFAVINESMEPQTVQVTLNGTQPWTLNPLFPPLLNMAPGETMLLYVGVAIPPNQLPGTIDDITLAAQMPGFPNSLTAATAQVLIVAPLEQAVPAFSTVGLIVLVGLVVAVGVVLLRRMT